MASITFGTPLQGFTDRRKGSLTVTPVQGPNNFSAYIYQCWLNVDWDGAHNAYGLDRPDDGARTYPLQKALAPREANGHLANARRGGVGEWVGLVAKTRQEAIQILKTNHPLWVALGNPRNPNEITAKQEAILDQFLDTRTRTPYGSLEDVPGNGKFPIVQLLFLGQPFPGYYVSQSMAFDRTRQPLNLWDQNTCLLYTSPSPRDRQKSRMPSSA